MRLETTPLHFGGVRWWFICPRTGRRAAKLYLPNGAHRFACRQAFRMAYRSQNASGMDETHMRIGRAVEKLGGTYRYPDEPPPRKPKWMRWKTYDRLAAKVEAAQVLHEAVLWRVVVASPAGSRSWMPGGDKLAEWCPLSPC